VPLPRIFTFGARQPTGSIPVDCVPMSAYYVILDNPFGNDMKPSTALDSHRAAIRRIVESHRARNARVFGSVLHGDDTEESDLDILIDPTSDTTLMDVAVIQVELEHLLGVAVDVLTPNALPKKFRETVLAEAVPV
jgi:predicted nucleotidyltransferase